MSRLANAAYRLSDWLARKRGREPRVVIGPKGPTVEYVEPKATSEYGWDSTHYHRGNVHLRGRHEPIKVSVEEVEDGEDDYEMLPSQNYKAALLATEVISRAFDPINMDKITTYLLVIGGLSSLTLVAVIALFAQVG